MKRFYKTATAEQAGEGWQVLLDGKPMRTPAKEMLVVPTRRLAEAIAAEWNGQGEEVKPATMPLTQFASTTIDGVRNRRDLVVETACAYAGSDLLCYRADHPQELADRQAAIWQPLLDWASARYGATLVPTAGIVHRQQDEAALTALRRAVEAYDDWRLCALQGAVGISGSLIVALALMDGRLTAEEVFAVSQLDESFQIEKWGEDAEAARRRAALRADLAATEAYLKLLAA